MIKEIIDYLKDLKNVKKTNQIFILDVDKYYAKKKLKITKIYLNKNHK